MLKEIAQLFKKQSPISPRLRPGEAMPEVPRGKVATRFHGEIVLVSKPKIFGEKMRGNSGYTERQLSELDEIGRNRRQLDIAREENLLFVG